MRSLNHVTGDVEREKCENLLSHFRVEELENQTPCALRRVFGLQTERAVRAFLGGFSRPRLHFFSHRFPIGAIITPGRGSGQLFAIERLLDLEQYAFDP